MRSVLFVCVCAWYVVVAQDLNAMRNMPKYDSRYDYLDVDAILDSKRLVKNYVECLINSQRCTPEGKALKRILPEALRTKCIRCTDRQKRTAVKVIKRLKYEYPEEWAKLSSRWDPTGDFTRYFEEYLAKDNNLDKVFGTGTNEISGSSPPTLPPSSSTVPPSLAPSPEPEPGSTPPTPVIVNRFGESEEDMNSSPSSMNGSPMVTVTPPPMASMTPPPMTMKPSPPPVKPWMTSRPTPMTWSGSASDSMPTRYPLRPGSTSPAFTTAITLIDQIGYKIMRTTELFTDILRNTVRAVVG